MSLSGTAVQIQASQLRRCNRASKHKRRRRSFQFEAPQGMQPFMCTARASQGAVPQPMWAPAHLADKHSIWRHVTVRQAGLPRLHRQGRSPLCCALRLWGQQHAGQICRADVVWRDAGAVNANGACLDACRPGTTTGLALIRERVWRVHCHPLKPKSMLCCAQAGCQVHRCQAASLTEAAECNSLMPDQRGDAEEVHACRAPALAARSFHSAGW